jgi:hypothetical protein
MSRIGELEKMQPPVIERVVEVPVEKIVEIEKIVEVPVEKIVEIEKIVEVPVYIEKGNDGEDDNSRRLTYSK